MLQAPSTGIYKPLNHGVQQIRVLHLYGPRTDGLLRADLKHLQLDLDSDVRPPKYEAISYCWDEVPGEDDIILNGELRRVPASAVKALRQFQPIDWPDHRVLWIDALCINQDDPLERSQQVQLMGEIYRGCTQCMIWLGDYDENAGRAIDSIMLVVWEMEEHHWGFSD